MFVVQVAPRSSQNCEGLDVEHVAKKVLEQREQALEHKIGVQGTLPKHLKTEGYEWVHICMEQCGTWYGIIVTRNDVFGCQEQYSHF